MPKFKNPQNIAFGIYRNPHEFFYEIDSKDKKFISYCYSQFEKLSIWETKKGYHLQAKDPDRLPENYEKLWKMFQKHFPSDYHKENTKIGLDKKEYFHTPATLRISEKTNALTGKIISPAPKFISGNWKAYWKDEKSECKRELIRYWTF